MRIRLFGRLYHSALVQNRVSRGLLAFTVKALMTRYRGYLKTQRRTMTGARVPCR
jgi:hypothetical protein